MYQKPAILQRTRHAHRPHVFTITLTTDITTTSYYADGFIYETKTYTHTTLQTHLGYTMRLQYLLHPEGRVRFVPGATAAQNKLVYDYHLTDHVGNVRVVLTEETTAPIPYAATMEEAARADEENWFEGIGSTVVDKPAGFEPPPTPPAVNNNHKVSRLFNVSGQDKRVGPAIALKVMTGDKITAAVRGWYLPGSSIATPVQPVIIENLLGSVFGAALPVGSKIPGATAATGTPLNIQPFIEDPQRTPNTDAPKAFLSYFLLHACPDKGGEVDLKLVGSVFGSTPIPRITGTMTAQVMQAAGGAEINITKNGYLFVFVSNEMERMRNSPNQLKDNNLPLKQSQANVFFLKPSIKAPRWGVGGPYPTGLEMFALSSSAANEHACPEKGGTPNRYTYHGQEK